MGKCMALMFLLPLLLLVSVFAEELQTLPPPHPHYPTPTPTPTPAPLHPPTYPPHHNHNHNHNHSHHHHPPAPAPSPSHHHYPPTHTPAPSPTHHHYPPTHTPAPTPSHHHHPHPPAPVPVPVKPPVHPPLHPAVPVHPPLHPPVPVHPPLHPLPRSFVAVQGVVYVKSCKYFGVDTLLGATPLLDAFVKLQCNNTKYKLVQTKKTDKNGYFYIEAPKSITTYGAHKCNVVLVSAPNGLKPSNLHGGVTGSTLRPEKPFFYQKLPFVLFTVGPLAFEPKCH